MSAPSLIPVIPGQIDGADVQLVDARQLHAFLAVGRDFTNWIKGRIRLYGFVEGEDFVTFDSPKWANQSSRGGDRRSIDYFLTLDMAKELAMVERTPRGREARRYFIACERQLRALREAARRQPPIASAHAPLAINLLTADLPTINRQAWADVAGENAARFHARREALLQQQRQLRQQAAVQGRFIYHRPAWAH